MRGYVEKMELEHYLHGDDCGCEVERAEAPTLKPRGHGLSHYVMQLPCCYTAEVRKRLEEMYPTEGDA